jgi:magnesium transporter
MIEIFKNTINGLESLQTVVEGAWINCCAPTTDDIDKLSALGIPQDFVTYPLDIDERPRIEREDDGSMLVVIRVPEFQGQAVDVPYTTTPLGIILTNNYIMTVSREPNEIIHQFTSGRARRFSTSKRNRFLLMILLQTATAYLSHLREINKIVDNLEDQLQQSMRNKGVMDLLKYNKSLVYFTTALRSNQLVLERLQRTQLFLMFPDDMDLLEDVITENQQAIEITNVSSNILSKMLDTFSSIISNNLNSVMKFLASVTIVLSVPTIITSYFGMNVTFPFNAHPAAYLGIIGLIMVISIIVIAVFLKRDWF